MSQDIEVDMIHLQSQPSCIQGTMRDYQIAALNWLLNQHQLGLNSILADEMGLGKSVQLLSLVEARKGSGPALIVCPASLVYNWAAECEKFTQDLTIEVVAGTKAQRRKLYCAATWMITPPAGSH